MTNIQITKRTIGALLISGLLLTFLQIIVLSVSPEQSATIAADVMTEEDWQEMVKLQEYIWQKELEEKLASAEKAMLEAAAATNAGATPAQKALFDGLMEDLGDKWSMDAPAGKFPLDKSKQLTAAQQKALQDAYDETVRNAAEKAEKELQKVAGEGTKKIGDVTAPKGGSKTVIKPPGSPGAGKTGAATVVKVIESKGSSAAGKGATGISRKGLSAAAAKIAATTAGKTLLKILPVLNTAATTIEVGTAVSDTLEEAVMTNIHAVDKLEKFLSALLREEGVLIKELSQLNAPEVLEAERALAEAEALLPQLEEALGKNNPQIKDLKQKIEAGRKAREANEKKRKDIERQLKKIAELKKKAREEIAEAEKKTGLIDVVVPVAVDTVKGIPGTVKDFINWISSPFSSPSANPPPPAEIHGPSIIVEIPPPIDNPDEVQLINMEIRALEGLRDRATNAKDKEEAQKQIDDAKAVRAKVIEKQNKKFKEEQAKTKPGNKKSNSGGLTPASKSESPKTPITPNQPETTVKTEDDNANNNVDGGSGTGGNAGAGAGAVGGNMGGDIICAMENVKRMTNAGPTYVRDAKAPKGIRAIPGKDKPTINAGEQAVFKFYTLTPSVFVEPNFTWSHISTQYDVPKVGRKDPDPKQKNRLILSTTECQVGVHGLMQVSFDQTVSATRGAKDGILITKGTCSLNIDCGKVEEGGGGGGGKESDYTVRPESYLADNGKEEWATALAIFPQQFTVDLDSRYTAGFDPGTWTELMKAKPFAIKFSTESGEYKISTDIAKGLIATDVPFKKGDTIYLSALFKGKTIKTLKSALGIKESNDPNNPKWTWGIGDKKTLQKTNKASHYVSFVGNDPSEDQGITSTGQKLDSFTSQQNKDGTFTIIAVVKPSLFGRVENGVRLIARLSNGNNTLSATKIIFSTASGSTKITQTPGLAEGITDPLKEERMTLTAYGVPADQAKGLTSGTYITFQTFNSLDSHVLPAGKGIEWTK